MKRTSKILSIVLLFVIIATIATNAFAVTNPKSLSGTDTASFNSIGNKIIGGIQAIGSIVAVAILVVLGIKYMIGSAEEKAEYKKTMIPYLIGAVLIFAASNIAGMVYNFASSI